MNNKATSVCVIGAGKIGLRHIESIILSQLNLDFHIVDPDPTVGDRLHKLLPASTCFNRVYIHKKVDSLPPNMEIAIIASTADIRLQLLQELIATSTVKYLILEKIAFQSVEQLNHANLMIQKYDIRTWVNCTRRMINVYREIYCSLKGLGPFKIDLQGIGWGLACNTIHYLDYYSWLINAHLIDLDSSHLDKVIHESRRTNYIEFTGTLIASYVDGSNLKITSRPGVNSMRRTAQISSKKSNWLLLEELNQCTLLDDENKIMLSGPISFQSQLSGTLVSSLLNTGECMLTEFNESLAYHTKMISTFCQHIEQVGGHSTHLCPVT